MLQHLLKSMQSRPQTDATSKRPAPQQDERTARVEAVQRTLRLYAGREVSVRELSNAAQVHEPQVRRILIQLTADGIVAFDGHRVRLIS